MLRPFLSLALALVLGFACLAQTPTGVIRLRVRVKVGESNKGLPRKRFFLIKGSLEQHKSLIEAIEQQTLETRDCFYKRAGASQALIQWLREHDCESVYCREIDLNDIEGPKAVPEFQQALAVGEKEFGSRSLAQKWLTVNLAAKIRDGFYRQRQEQLRRLIKQAEQLSGAPVLSVMGDRNGTAYFTDLEPGPYLISSLIPVELGNQRVTWNCPIQVKAGDLATERPYLVSNRADRNVKCVGVEKPLPVCELAPAALR